MFCIASALKTSPVMTLLVLTVTATASHFPGVDNLLVDHYLDCPILLPDTPQPIAAGYILSLSLFSQTPVLAISMF